MRHRFDGHHTLSLGLLSLIETLNPGVEPDRKVGRLHKRPGQILIAVLGVTLAFFLAVADLLTADAAAVAGVRSCNTTISVVCDSHGTPPAH